MPSQLVSGNINGQGRLLWKKAWWPSYVVAQQKRREQDLCAREVNAAFTKLFTLFIMSNFISLYNPVSFSLCAYHNPLEYFLALISLILHQFIIQNIYINHFCAFYHLYVMKFYLFSSLPTYIPTLLLSFGFCHWILRSSTFCLSSFWGHCNNAPAVCVPAHQHTTGREERSFYVGGISCWDWWYRCLQKAMCVDGAILHVENLEEKEDDNARLSKPMVTDEMAVLCLVRY